MLALLTSAALAQSCSCSVGGGGGVLPSASVLMPGMAVVSAETSTSLVGGDGWRGFAWTDRQGNSMPTMAMPGHRAFVASPTLILGLPSGFALSLGVPIVHAAPLFPSDMRGDVTRGFLGDTALSARWVRFHEGFGTAYSVGVSLPTGKVIEGGAVRGGRGVTGLTGAVHATLDASPYATLGLAISTARDLYTPADGYRVADTASATLGARLTPRERGKFALLSYGMLRWEGHDRSGDSELDQTGFVGADLLTGFQWRFWAHHMRSLTWTTRAQVPVWQVVGDPWIAENYGVSTGLAYAFGLVGTTKP